MPVYYTGGKHPSVYAIRARLLYIGMCTKYAFNLKVTHIEFIESTRACLWCVLLMILSKTIQFKYRGKAATSDSFSWFYVRFEISHFN